MLNFLQPGGGQKDGHRSPTAPGRAAGPDADGSVMLLSDALAHPQAQARADLLLGRKERLKKPVTDFCRNSRTGIRNGDPNSRPAACVASSAHLALENTLCLFAALA